MTNEEAIHNIFNQLVDLTNRVTALEKRYNAQSVRMSTIDDHIALNDADRKQPKILLETKP